jgi:hypothetical protein
MKSACSSLARPGDGEHEAMRGRVLLMPVSRWIASTAMQAAKKAGVEDHRNAHSRHRRESGDPVNTGASMRRDLATGKL